MYFDLIDLRENTSFSLLLKEGSSVQLLLRAILEIININKQKNLRILLDSVGLRQYLGVSIS